MAGYRVEIAPPDIRPYREGSAGIPYALTFDSGRPGPHALIAALMHGNELCGAWALCTLLQRGIRPRRGRLSLVFANVAAFERFDPCNPTASRYIDEDMNRVWHPARIEGRERSRELDRARELQPLVDDADVILDVHSMQLPAPPLLLCGTTERGRALALAMGYPAFVIADGGHSNGTRLRDYGAFGERAGARTAMLVECGQHWTRASVDVAVATCLHFLRACDLVAPEALAAHLPDLPRLPQRVIEVTEAVTVGAAPFRFVQDFQGLEVIPKAGTVLGYAGQHPVRTPYDDCVLIMPSRRLTRGLTAVRLGRFVDDR
jgi:predicted deacylase